MENWNVYRYNYYACGTPSEGSLGSGPRGISEGSNPTNHTPEPYHTTDYSDKMWSFEEGQGPSQGCSLEDGDTVTIVEDSTTCSLQDPVPNAATVVEDPGSTVSSGHAPFEYSLKVINPTKMSDFKTFSIHGRRQCKSFSDLKDLMEKSIPSDAVGMPNLHDVEIGYIEPGRGVKGRKIWLRTDADVKEMYAKHQGKKKINLWCYSQSKKAAAPKKGKRSNSPVASGSGCSSKYNSHLQNIEKVDEVYDQLQEKHKGKFSPEQLRTWAHLVQMGKHGSTEEPPDKPFFRGQKRSADSRPKTAGGTPESKKHAPTAISPCRKVNLRSELIEQLDKWHKLLDSGAINQQQYDELQQTILCDIKQLSSTK